MSVAVFPLRYAGSTPVAISLNPAESISARIAHGCAPNARPKAYCALLNCHTYRHAGRILPAPRLSLRSAPASIPHSLAAWPVPNFPRLRALALFGRRSLERAQPPSCRRPKTSTICDFAGKAAIDAKQTYTRRVHSMFGDAEREVGETGTPTLSSVRMSHPSGSSPRAFPQPVDNRQAFQLTETIYDH